MDQSFEQPNTAQSRIEERVPPQIVDSHSSKKEIPPLKQGRLGENIRIRIKHAQSGNVFFFSFFDFGAPSRIPSMSNANCFFASRESLSMRGLGQLGSRNRAKISGSTRDKR